MAHEVLVVGAGPTGLALAAQLRAYRVRFRIVDRQLDRVHESRALAVQPRTLEVLAGLGVTGELLARGNRAVRLLIHAGGRVVPVRLFDIGIDDTAYPYLLFVSQAETERILGEHLRAGGVALERGVELVDLERDGDRARCRLRHRDGRDEVLYASYVVGCDGAHSAVRRLSGIPFTGAAYPQTFVLADLEADGIEPGAAHAFAATRGVLLFFPLGAPATWRMIAMRPAGDPTPPDRPVTLDELRAVVDGYPAAGVRLRDPVWMTNFRLHHRGAARYRAGPVLLAGDAAHIHSPAGAQGMNTGIQDAVNLGWKLGLVTAGADPRLLDTYQPERAPIGRYVLRLTDRAFRVATSANPVVAFARTRVPRLIPLLLKPKSLRTYGFRLVSQLAVGYRDSPLSVDGPDPPRRGPRAGDRLPDAEIVHDGQASSLHGMLSAPGWHLLLCGPADPSAEDALAGVRRGGAGPVTVHRLAAHDGAGVLLDPTGQALRRLGLTVDSRAHYVVRPDGHIGYRAGGHDLAGAMRYLARRNRPPAVRRSQG